MLRVYVKLCEDMLGLTGGAAEGLMPLVIVTRWFVRLRLDISKSSGFAEVGGAECDYEELSR